MSYYLRDTIEQDKYTANEWLVKWEKLPRDLEIYPEDGLVLSDDNNELFIGFIWITKNSKSGMIGFINRNPNVKIKDKTLRRKFSEELIKKVKSYGCDFVMTWTDSQFLKKDFREIGLTEMGDTVSEFVAKIY